MSFSVTIGITRFTFLASSQSLLTAPCRLNLNGISSKRETVKTNIVGINDERKIFFDKTLREQLLFVINNFLLIGKYLLSESILRHSDYQSVFGLLNFTGEAFLLHMIKQSVKVLRIDYIRNSECSVPFQGAVTNFKHNH